MNSRKHGKQLTSVEHNFCMLQTVFSFCPLNHHAPIPSQSASSCVGARVKILQSQIYVRENIVEMKGTCASILLVKPLPFSFSFHSTFELCKKTKKWILFSREKHFQFDVVESAAKGTNLVKQAASFVCSRKRWRKKKTKLAVYEKETAGNFILMLLRKKILVL